MLPIAKMNNSPSQGDDFLGVGIAFPLAVDSGGSVVLNRLEDHVRQSILLIVQTGRGERVMQPDFGGGLTELVFEPLDPASITLAQQHIRESLGQFEPRIDVLNVDVTFDSQQPDRLVIDLEYRVRSTDTIFNLVFPFYIQEGGL